MEEFKEIAKILDETRVHKTTTENGLRDLRRAVKDLNAQLESM